MSDPWLGDVEAYLLGALDEPERTAFEEHLRSCLACRAALDEVGPIPALLDLVPPDMVAALAAADPVTAGVPGPPAERVPESVLAGLLWSVRAERGRRRRRVLAGALALAAAVLLLLVVPASPLALVGRTRPADAEVLAMVAQGSSPVTATVALEQVAWGTRIDLSCAYPSPGRYDGPSSAVYALLVLGDDGSQQQVATWTAVPGRTISVPAATDRTLEQISSLELVGSGGEVLLSVDL